MLYYMYDFGRAALDNLAPSATIARTLLSMPLQPFPASCAARTAEAVGELAGRAVGYRPPRPRLLIETVPYEGRTVRVSRRVLERRAFGRLLRFETARPRLPRLLAVHPLSGHHPALLEDFYFGLLAGQDLYVADWRDARDVPVEAGEFGLDDQVACLIDYLRRIGPDAHLVAFSQSTVPALMAAALLAAEEPAAAPASVTLIAGPVDPRRDPRPLDRFIRGRSHGWLAHHLTTRVPLYYAGAGRRVYPGFIQLGGYISAAFGEHVGAHLAFFERLMAGDGDGAEMHRRFLDRFHAVMDLPADLFLDMAGRVFREAALAAGTMRWRGKPVDPGSLSSTALMTVEAGSDILVGGGQTHAAQDICAAIPRRRRRRHTARGAGHLGVVQGPRWRKEVLPRIEAFVRAHDSRHHAH